MERLITEQEEQAIRLCHFNFGNLSTKAAAVIMGISQRRVQQLLQSAKKKAPQLWKKLGTYRRPKTVRYESFMDDKVIRTF